MEFMSGSKISSGLGFSAGEQQFQAVGDSGRHKKDSGRHQCSRGQV